ncbi:MAG: thrombospondin type 3 repeat-containing protein [Gammaproteobacteria bacterium]
MKNPRIFTLALLASGLLATTAHAQVTLESVTYEGELPEIALFSFFQSDEIGFDSTSGLVTGLPKFDPALGTLVDMQVSFDFEYFLDAYLEGEGIFDGGIPHIISANMSQRVIGLTYERADGGTSGFIEVDKSFGLGCFGNPGDGNGCSDDVSFGGGFGAVDLSLFDDVALDDIVGTGDLEILGLTIDYIDVFFDLDNIGAAFLEVFTEVVPESSTVSVTYTYDAGVSEPDTDEDGVVDSADSCINVPNANQEDSDGDGYGDACDADINNDCVVNAVDLGQLRLGFFGSDPVLDFNSDGAVNAVDLGIMRLAFFGTPGPSGLSSVCD